jgi:hypothetical protein
MIRQREVSIIVSSSIAISDYNAILDIVKDTGQKRSRVICELLKMGLGTYKKYQESKTK